MFDLFAAFAGLAVMLYAFGLMLFHPRRTNRGVRRVRRWFGRRIRAAVAWLWRWFWRAVWYVARQIGRGVAALVRFCWARWPWQTAIGIAVVVVAPGIGAIYGKEAMRLIVR
ncbi:hypothetical protein HYW67_03215 [Candidatus Parcubacteria bacterium]|nr:hypothetical protein [Candidatus Parcubacteria bacterium]